MFGGRSSSSTSTTTTTEIEQFDERVAGSARDEAVVVQLRDRSRLTVIDPGAFKLIEETFEEQLEAFENLVGLAFEFAGGAAEKAARFAQSESDKATEVVLQVLEQDQSEDRQNFGDLLKWGAVIAIGVTAVGAFKGR